MGNIPRVLDIAEFMLKYLSQFLILSCLLGQVVHVFGLPLAITSNQTASVSLQMKNCCASGVNISCCGNDCLCCPSNEIPADDIEAFQENSTGRGVQIFWLNPISTNKCKATSLISQLGVEMVFQEVEAMVLVLASGSNPSPEGSFLSPGFKFSQFKPPRI